MTRRDTIIIATLVNAGLLACLFVTATRQEDMSPQSLANNYEIADNTPTYKEENTSSSSSYVVDEVDQALKEFLPDESPLVTDYSLEADLNPDLVKEKSEPTPAYVASTAPNLVTQPPALPATMKKDQKIVEVTVKKGDMLEKIARANGTTVKAIKEVNFLSSDNLRVGQVLKVPTGTVAEKPVEKTKAEPIALNNSEPQYYIVQSGDNPWKIAKKFHVKFEDILKLNNMTEEKSKNLKVGQEIRVK